VSLRDENGKNDGSVERSKIAIGRTPGPKNAVEMPSGGTNGGGYETRATIA
jgi:hypothetical protein